MIANLDDNMARLWEYLKKEDLESNTILIFMTDNGTAAGYLEMENGEGYHGYNAGMRGIKGSHYEGGHRVPFFMRWPGGGLTGGKDMEGLSAHVDVLPTLMDLCGMEYDLPHNQEGMSLADRIRGEEGPDTLRMLITDTQRIQWPEKGRNSCVMQSKWRLISGKELYNIENDPGQKMDLSEVYPGKVMEMNAAYEEWWEKVEEEAEYSPIPIGNPDAGPVILTAHDIHAPTSEIPWSQYLVRTEDKSARGTYLLEVIQSGDYRFDLARWPFESGLSIGDRVAAVMPDLYTEGFPPGARKWFSTAGVEVEGGSLFRSVADNGQPFASVDCKLEKGRHRIRVFFTDSLGLETGACYVRIHLN